MWALFQIFKRDRSPWRPGRTILLYDVNRLLNSCIETSVHEAVLAQVTDAVSLASKSVKTFSGYGDGVISSCVVNLARNMAIGYEWGIY